METTNSPVPDDKIVLDTFGKKWAWVYTKAEIVETTDAKMPVFGFKALSPSGKKDFIKSIHNCPITNEIVETYDQSGTTVRFLGKGLYPLQTSKRNKCKVRVTFSDKSVFNVDYSDTGARKLLSGVLSSRDVSTKL